MFSRFTRGIDNFIDTHIADEQSRQKGAQTPPARRAATGPRRPGGRTDSPGHRPSSRVRDADGADRSIAKGPDPSEFVIEDDEPPSRGGTPKPPIEKVEEGMAGEMKEKAGTEGDDTGSVAERKKAQDVGSDGVSDLPRDVQLRLRKLEKLEAKYNSLLRSYRIAHARVSAIEPFEASIRENTPLTSISEPGAFVEYLSQINLKGDMVMEELKRVSGERDGLKTKLDEAERKTKEAYDEAAGLREERDAALHRESRSAAVDEQAESHSERENTKPSGNESDPLGASAINDAPAIPTPDTKPTPQEKGPAEQSSEPNQEDSEFFSIESELPRLQNEVTSLQTKISEHIAYIEELTTENAVLRSDLASTKESHETTITSLETVSQKLRLAQEAKQNLEAEKTLLESVTAALAVEKARSADESAERMKLADLSKADLKRRLEQVEETLETNRAELNAQVYTADANVSQVLAVANDVEGEELRRKVDALAHIFVTLDAQAKDAENGKKAVEGDFVSLRAELERVEKERDTATKKAESKKGHESAVASLKSQLKRLERERDEAYQMILDCGKCELPKTNVTDETGASSSKSAQAESMTRERGASDTTEATEATQATAATETTDATEVSATPPVGGAEAASKKSKKSKNKKKKKPAASTAPTESPSASTTPAPESDIPNALNNAAVGEPTERTETGKSVDGEKASVERSEDAPLMSATMVKIMEYQTNNVAKEKDDQITALEKIVEEKDEGIEELKTQIKTVETAAMSTRTELESAREVVETMKGKLKEQDDLREEIEGLKDDLINVGSDVTDAKYKVKELTGKNAELTTHISELENEVSEAQKRSKADLEAENRLEELRGLLSKVQTERQGLQSERAHVQEELD
ncbi:Golgin imh1, partial [Elasticomyces elasticus]